MAKGKNQKERPLVSMTGEEREETWDEVFVKEEGMILEFDLESCTGKIKSSADGEIYKIDSRELIRTRIEWRSGDKVLFAPIEDTTGDDYARIIGIVDLNA